MSFRSIVPSLLIRLVMWIAECRDTARCRAAKSREIGRNERSSR